MIDNLNTMIRDDLDALALSIDLPTVSSITGKPKSLTILIAELDEKLTLLSQEEVYNIFLELFTCGKFDGYILKTSQTTMFKQTIIEKKFKKLDKNGVSYYIPKTVDWLFDECIVIQYASFLICIRKHLKKPLQLNTCRTILKNFFGVDVTFAYTINLVRNIFEDLKNKDLACSFADYESKKLILFYNAHAADGKYLTIASKLLSSNEKITKDYKDSDGALDTVTILQDFLKHSKDNKAIEKLIEHFILKSPSEVVNALVELKFDILLVKKGTDTIRYKVNLKKSELKILNIDSSLEDVLDVVKMLLKIKGIYDVRYKDPSF